MIRIVLLLMSTALAGLAAGLPVTQVTLYKHGVGFFERSGTVAAGESAQLDFTAAEMNDVLKSLTVSETGGGKITGLRYDAMDPLSQTLAAFPFQIGNSQPISSLLDQLKGAQVVISFGATSLTGIVVNGRVIAGNDKQPEREELTLLLDSGDIRTVDLGASSGIHFTGAKLQRQFREYLAAEVASRSKERRNVYIDSTSTGSRQFTASYMAPSAVWKSSYRLLFSTEKPILEGWAMVDNTTGSDWNKVQLALVSGRPISFVSPLYAPKYVTRPTAELADDVGAAPVVHASGIRFAAPSKDVAGVVGGVSGRASGGMVFSSAAPPPPAQAKAVPSTLVNDTSGEEVGELFEYRIAQPVTIAHNQSAMLPFLQQPIQARKLLIYSNGASTHPTNAFELTNTSGKTLDGGPITVYDGGAYGGEALVETLKSGDKRLVSYAVDLGTTVTTAYGSSAETIREMHANRGVLTTQVATEETRNYTVKNVDQKAKTLVLEHPLRQDYTLLNRKPTERTPEAYRFEIALAAGATVEYPVQEERVYSRTYSLTNATDARFLAYIQEKSLSAAGRAQLQRIAEQKAAIAANDRDIAAAAKQLNELIKDEERIRSNMQTLSNVGSQQPQVQTYAAQLESSEQKIVALRDRQADLEKKRYDLAAALGKLFEALSF